MPYFVKNKHTAAYGIYGTTNAILEDYPTLNVNKIYYRTSRHKEPYIDDTFEVYYCEINRGKRSKKS